MFFSKLVLSMVKHNLLGSCEIIKSVFLFCSLLGIRAAFLSGPSCCRSEGFQDSKIPSPKSCKF